MSFETPLPPYNASDPSATFVNASCLDLLLIELVPLAYRMANEVDAGERAGLAGYASVPNRVATGIATEVKERTSNSIAGAGNATVNRAVATVQAGPSSPSRLDEDEERDAVFFRLESLGYRVGQGLVERYGSLLYSEGVGSRANGSIT